MAQLAEIVKQYSDSKGVLNDVPRELFERALMEYVSISGKNNSKNSKKKKNSGPKRPKSSYMFWLDENRSEIKEKYFGDFDEIDNWDLESKINYYKLKDLKEPTKEGKPKIVALVTSKAGKIWKNLSEEEKEPYNTMSNDAREKYISEKEHFVEDEEKDEEDEEEFDVEKVLENWNGPFKNKFIEKNVKGNDGKTIKIFKSFKEAIDAAESLGDSCYGITQTKRGFSIRIGELKDTPSDNLSKGIASWTKKDFNGILKSKRGRRKGSGKKVVDDDDDTEVHMEDIMNSNIKDKENEEEEEEGMAVVELKFNGKTYYHNEATNDIYDPQSGDKVGTFNDGEIDFD